MTPPAAPAATASSAERHDTTREPETARVPESGNRFEAVPRAAPEGDAETPALDVTLASLGPDNWHQLLSTLGLTGIVHNVASHCELRSCGEGRLHFRLDESNATLFNDSHPDKLRLALENAFGEPLKVTIEIGQVGAETPAMRQTRLASERQQQAIESIENDPNLQALMSRFDGELDRASIVPTDA